VYVCVDVFLDERCYKAYARTDVRLVHAVMLPNSLITGALVWSPEGPTRVLAHTHIKTHIALYTNANGKT